VKFGVDARGQLCCKVSRGWVDFCAMHGVLQGDKVQFSVAAKSTTNFMHAFVHPRVSWESFRKPSLLI
jgi:hypothetical protein